jgi:hypothetical protein
VKYIWPESINNVNVQRVTQLLSYRVFDSEIGRNWTIGTLPTALSAQQLWHYSSNAQEDTFEKHQAEFNTLQSAGVYWTLQTSQPVVIFTCSPPFYHTNNISYFHANGSTSILRDAAELYDAMLKINANRTWFMSWIQTPEDPTSLLALVMYNAGVEADSTDDDLEQKNSFAVCTVSSFWWDTSTSLSLTTTANLIQTDLPKSTKGIVQDKYRSIIIEPGGITPLYIDQATWNSPYYGNDFSASIVVAIVVALSWIPGRDAQADYRSIAEDMIEGMNLSSIKDSTSYTPLRIVRKITGYGYGGTGTSTQLSLAVIVAYCFITIIYIVYIVVTGHTSIAWNLATELIILALQSKEPGDLGHVSVGIDSMETLHRSVGIRVNTVNIGDTAEHMEKLELVFEHDGEHRRTLKKVKLDQAY